MLKPGPKTKYRPEMVQSVVDMGVEGQSITEIASNLKTTRNTLYRWGKEHEEFGEALEMALEGAQAWFERIGRSNLDNPKFNAFLWAKCMMRFPEYRGASAQATPVQPFDLSKIERVIIEPSKEIANEAHD